ncbi:autorepressor SdpR family transcription factor [Ruminococcaceae bacterium OttesenSCG-928-A11]|nr:autorepressor SdpR family transcription factor [Ruminococcaceae bacterium OttesenSCG-928-A11]
MGNDVFKALGDPTRRQILEMLAREGDLSAGEIASHFEMSAPSVSHHLSILKNAGLVLDTRHRQSIVYSLNTTVFQDVVKWIYDISGKGGEP